jgi:hypothetical protein
MFWVVDEDVKVQTSLSTCYVHDIFMTTCYRFVKPDFVFQEWYQRFSATLDLSIV